MASRIEQAGRGALRGFVAGFRGVTDAMVKIERAKTEDERVQAVQHLELAKLELEKYGFDLDAEMKREESLSAEQRVKIQADASRDVAATQALAATDSTKMRTDADRDVAATQALAVTDSAKMRTDADRDIAQEQTRRALALQEAENEDARDLRELESDLAALKDSRDEGATRQAARFEAKLDEIKSEKDHVRALELQEKAGDIAVNLEGVKGAVKVKQDALKLFSELMKGSSDEVLSVIDTLPESFQHGFMMATVQMEPKKQLTVARNLRQLLSEGKTQQAYELVGKVAVSELGEAEARRYAGRTALMASLELIEQHLEELKEEGIRTGKWTGTIEDALNRIGMTSDPRIRTLAAEITSAVVSYRQAVSGSAFTESERQEYASLFPALGNVEALNLASIQGIRNSAINLQNEFLEQHIGTLLGDEMASPTPSLGMSPEEKRAEAAKRKQEKLNQRKTKLIRTGKQE